MAKEHPNCRRQIIKKGIVPLPSADEWDGRAADASGKPFTAFDGNMRLQMGKMILEGYEWPAKSN